MTKREKSALALERKILRAIERGEFTPDYGYLSRVVFSPGGEKIEVGPCGCAIAAAASVNGMTPPDPSYTASHDPEDILVFLKRVAHLRMQDGKALEQGYEQFSDLGPLPRGDNPYYKLGLRLRRFHPNQNGRVE